ncbi:MAG: AMP-binding protein [Flammeovirgaceae bacterium]|nr:AMP-binding protein [Flammeovirgaceae bacterium]MDW8287274.1 AMP-binding protein [Flammeovirgaceae bacterium]
MSFSSSYTSKIYIENQCFEASVLMTKNYWKDFSDWQALRFCLDWMKGEQVFFQQTSGSTGTPKTIPITRKQMLASIHLTQKTFSLTSKDKALVAVNTSFIAGKMMLARALQIGMDMFIAPISANPLLAIQKSCFSDFQPTFAAFVPYQLSTMIDNDASLARLRQFRVILIGGASVSTSLAEKINTLLTDVEVFHTYGMTETASHIAIRSIRNQPDEPIFEVLEGITINKDERNCLKICGEVTNNEWITTNDLVEILDCRCFRLIGRIDNVINSGGIKISLEEIEQKIAPCLHDLTWKRYFLAGLPDEKWGEKLVLFLEGTSFHWKEEETLRQRIAQFLEPYQRPKEIFFLEKFEETDSQKIDRKKTIANFQKNNG